MTQLPPVKEEYHENDDDLDSEWEDFGRLLEEYKLRKRNQAASPVLSARHQRPNPQAFYPCPLPQNQDAAFDFDYVQTAMYGRYTKELGEYARQEAKKLKIIEKERKKVDRQRNRELHKYRGKCASKIISILEYLWKHTFAKLGEDWIFLTILGIIVALISFGMDRGISVCSKARIFLYRELAGSNVFIQYLSWICIPIFLILFSAGFAHIVAPQSIGSGIPEMKTILRGVALKEYLTFRTLVAKAIGLTATIGSGMPLGKEGPLVHMASIVATLLSKLITSFKGIYENESRNFEMLGAAAAVGVASCFAAPIGGVLFSIEVTTVYFAVRNYWRGYYAAVCGALTFRLLAVWIQNEATVTAVFKTNFTTEFPYDPQELVAYAIIGIISGFGGAAYVWIHRQYVLAMRRSKALTNFLQKNRFLYPGIVIYVLSSVTFPKSLGQFMASHLSTHDQVVGLFSNFTWGKPDLTVEEFEVVRHWTSPYSGIFVSLSGFLLFNFFFSIISATVPVPSGGFIPVFKVGAALGRIIGEIMHIWFPDGVRYAGVVTPIIPGGYATVGAGAFSGAVTHTISTSVIVFEMTGQITHAIPIMVAVLIANAVAALLQPSIYDSIILIKKLPYLPDIIPSSAGVYKMYVEDFMIRDVKFIWHGMTYVELRDILKENRNLKGFPLVDSPGSMILLGSIQRLELIKLIEANIGRDRRLEVAAKWQKEAEERAREEIERKKMEEAQRQRERRPSRFEVIPAPDILKLRQHSDNNLLSPHAVPMENGEPHFNPVFGSQPKKSILKKTNSFTLRGLSPLMTPNATPYTTVTGAGVGAESRMRLAFEAIFKKSATLQDVNPDPEAGAERDATDKDDDKTSQKSMSMSPRLFKKVQLPRERVIDMSFEHQRQWEQEQMSKPVNFDSCHIDPAPFQLVERTSLLKVHSLFSMVGVNHAYVTAIGRLIGVVALKELRKAIEDANTGNIPTPQTVTMPLSSKLEVPLMTDPRATSVDCALNSNAESDTEDNA